MMSDFVIVDARGLRSWRCRVAHSGRAPLGDILVTADELTLSHLVVMSNLAHNDRRDYKAASGIITSCRAQRRVRIGDGW